MKSLSMRVWLIALFWIPGWPLAGQTIGDLVWVRSEVGLTPYDLSGNSGVVAGGLPMGNWGTCVDGLGNIWSTDFVAGSNTVSHIDGRTGAVLGTYVAGPVASGSTSTVGPVCCDRDGYVYVGDPGGSTVTVLDGMGSIVRQFSIQGSDIRTMCVDGNGDLWLNVYDRWPGFGAVLKYTSEGQLLFALAPSGSYPNQVWADEWGRVTISHWPQTYKTTQVDYQGNVIHEITSISSGSNLLIGVAPDGKVWIGGYSGLSIFDETGSLVEHHALYFPGSIAFDGLGNAWVAQAPGVLTSTSTVTLRKYSPNGALLSEFAAGPALSTTAYYNIGDFTGMQYARVVDPDGDLDGDGHGNREEVLAKSSPMDPLSQPASSSLELVSAAVLGGTLVVDVSIPLDAGMFYAVPFSLNPAPFSLSELSPGDPRTLWVNPLNPFADGLDPLFALSVDPASTVFTGTIGALSAQGKATVSVPIPNDPSLIGVRCVAAAVTLHEDYGSGIKSLTDRLSIEVR